VSGADGGYPFLFSLAGGFLCGVGCSTGLSDLLLNSTNLDLQGRV